MFKLDLLEYETNKELGNCKLSAIPRVGEFFIFNKTITANWKKDFYIVRAVTYTIGGDIIVHLQYHDIEEAERKEKELKDKLKDIFAKAKEGERE